MTIHKTTESFNLAIGQFGIDTERKLILALKKIMLIGLQTVVHKTPVDKGRMRGAWQVSLNLPSVQESSKDGDKLSKSEAEQLARAMAEKLISEANRIPNAGLGLVVFISNNVQYAVYVDGDEAIVDTAMLKMKSVFRRTA